MRARARTRPVLGRDYVIVERHAVWTKEYLLKLGACCGQRCQNCPYATPRVPQSEVKPRLQPHHGY